MQNGAGRGRVLKLRWEVWGPGSISPVARGEQRRSWSGVCIVKGNNGDGHSLTSRITPVMIALDAVKRTPLLETVKTIELRPQDSIDRGKPIQNGLRESFQRRLRDELLHEHWFLGPGFRGEVASKLQ